MNNNILNAQQQSIVKEAKGYIRVIAGAGSGKTRILTSRFINLVKEYHVDPARILCMTFTRKAAEVIRQRIKEEINDISSFSLSTFHSFGNLFLKEEINALGYPKNFKIYDEYNQRRIIAKIEKAPIKSISRNDMNRINNHILDAKLKIRYAERMMSHKYENHILTAADNIPDYQKIDAYLLYQRKGKWLDFDDLILFTEFLLKTNKEILARWQERFDYLEIDEAQDLSKPEMEIIELLSKKSGNLLIVGDPDQNIYQWRKSSNDFLLNFDKVHKSCQTFFMTINYRSGIDIISCSNNLIRYNKKRLDKELIPFKKTNNPVMIKSFSFSQCTDDIISAIKKSIEAGEHYSDNAVFYRCHFMSQDIENSLKAGNIPYQVLGSTSFYETSEIVDVISLIKLAVDEDDPSFIRMINKPPKGFGAKKLEYLVSIQKDESLYKTLNRHICDDKFEKTNAFEFMEAMNNIKARIKSGEWNASESVRHLLLDTGYLGYVTSKNNKEGLDDIGQFSKNVEEYQNSNKEKGLNEYLKEYLAPLLEKDQSPDSVQLMTVHAAKGLEFKNVYIIDANRDCFPYKRALEEEQDGLEAERRLFYVAMTRAKDSLTIYNTLGNTNNDSPSPFIRELRKGKK